MHRISLENEFLEGANNVYLFHGEEVVLVDTSFDTSSLREQLIEGFAAVDTEVADLDRIYLTHYHIDHCGLLEWLVSESSASVHAHPDDASLIEGDEQAWEQVIQKRYQLLDQWGVPQEDVSSVEDALIEGSDIYGDVSVTPAPGQTEIDLGTTTLRTIHTPGHSLGHLAFERLEEQDILTGDALLPVYTPNVGGADIRVDRPLERYVQTLQRIAASEYKRAWPGHRTPIANPTERANEIITHHEQRALRVLQAVADLEPTTPWEISTRLFGSLEGVHTLHGPGEVYAHLDHLARDGTLERTGKNYRLTSDGEHRLSEMDCERWPLV